MTATGTEKRWAALSSQFFSALIFSSFLSFSFFLPFLRVGEGIPRSSVFSFTSLFFFFPSLVDMVIVLFFCSFFS